MSNIIQQHHAKKKNLAQFESVQKTDRYIEDNIFNGLNILLKYVNTIKKYWYINLKALSNNVSEIFVMQVACL